MSNKIKSLFIGLKCMHRENSSQPRHLDLLNMDHAGDGGWDYLLDYTGIIISVFQSQFLGYMQICIKPCLVFFHWPIKFFKVHCRIQHLCQGFSVKVDTSKSSRIFSLIISGTMLKLNYQGEKLENVGTYQLQSSLQAVIMCPLYRHSNNY